MDDDRPKKLGGRVMAGPVSHEKRMMETLNCIASQYSSLINATLTILLVGVTGWYAFVTRKMWREMAEARLASIRPLLLISVTTLEKKQPPQGENTPTWYSVGKWEKTIWEWEELCSVFFCHH